MTEEHMLSCVSFLLGKMHGSIYMVLNSDQNDADKIFAFEEWEAELRTDIERLYYPTCVPELTE